MAQTIRIKRGTKATLPTTGMSVGEPHWTTDRGTLHVADAATTTLPLVPAVDDLTTLPSVDGSNDLLLIHDGSETTGQKEKKITFSAFKAALNIPAASTDELVAVVSGGTSGYLWGTTGSDGVLRAGSALDYTKDAGNGYVTFDLADNGVTTAKILNSAVTTVKINDLAVTTGKLAAGAVTNAKIGAGAVDTTQLAAGAVTNAKLDATALDLNATTFTGNGVTTQLDVAVIDGGTF